MLVTVVGLLCANNVLDSQEQSKTYRRTQNYQIEDCINNITNAGAHYIECCQADDAKEDEKKQKQKTEYKDNMWM